MALNCRVQTEVDPDHRLAVAGEGACLLVGEQPVTVASAREFA